MLGDELRLEAPVPVSGYLDGQLTEFTLERLAVLAVAGVAGRIGDWLVLAVAKVNLRLGLQCALDQRLW